MFVPLPLALAAHRAGDEEMLVAVAAGDAFEDGTRWHRAQKALARGIALAALGRPASTELDFAQAENEQLGAPFFASLAARYAGRTPAPEPPGVSPAYSARERQIRAFLNEGRDAASIATSLGLSPRIVAHCIESMRPIDLV
jgi:DNA-binding NarL/FixJ family response regulator